MATNTNRVTEKDGNNFNSLVLLLNLLFGNYHRILAENMKVLANIIQKIPEQYTLTYNILKELYDFDNKLLAYSAHFKKFLYSIIQCFFLMLRNRVNPKCIHYDIPDLECDFDEFQDNIQEHMTGITIDTIINDEQIYVYYVTDFITFLDIEQLKTAINTIYNLNTDPKKAKLEVLGKTFDFVTKLVLKKYPSIGSVDGIPANLTNDEIFDLCRLNIKLLFDGYFDYANNVIMFHNFIYADMDSLLSNTNNTTNIFSVNHDRGIERQVNALQPMPKEHDNASNYVKDKDKAKLKPNIEPNYVLERMKLANTNTPDQSHTNYLASTQLVIILQKFDRIFIDASGNPDYKKLKCTGFRTWLKRNDENGIQNYIKVWGDYFHNHIQAIVTDKKIIIPIINQFLQNCLYLDPGHNESIKEKIDMKNKYIKYKTKYIMALKNKQYI